MSSHLISDAHEWIAPGSCLRRGLKSKVLIERRPHQYCVSQLGCPPTAMVCVPLCTQYGYYKHCGDGLFLFLSVSLSLEFDDDS